MAVSNLPRDNRGCLIHSRASAHHSGGCTPTPAGMRRWALSSSVPDGKTHLIALLGALWTLTSLGGVEPGGVSTGGGLNELSTDFWRKLALGVDLTL